MQVVLCRIKNSLNIFIKRANPVWIIPVNFARNIQKFARSFLIINFG